MLLRDKADFGGLAAPLPRFVRFLKFGVNSRKRAKKEVKVLSTLSEYLMNGLDRRRSAEHYSVLRLLAGRRLLLHPAGILFLRLGLEVLGARFPSFPVSTRRKR